MFLFSIYIFSGGHFRLQRGVVKSSITIKFYIFFLRDGRVRLQQDAQRIRDKSVGVKGLRRRAIRRKHVRSASMNM